MCTYIYTYPRLQDHPVLASTAASTATSKVAAFVELVHNCLAQVQAEIGHSDDAEPV